MAQNCIKEIDILGYTLNVQCKCAVYISRPLNLLQESYLPLDRLYVTVGEYDINRQDEHEQVIKADSVIIHEQYNPTTFENDIGKYSTQNQT